jgi:hypothetical protein
LGVAAVLGLACTGPAQAGEAYFLLVFGSQRTPNDPDYSHSFATFVRATWDGPAPVAPRLEVHTISWLPSNLRIRALALLPECGHNYELHMTLRWAFANRERVSLWGPYQIDRDLYLRALAQISLLESGQVRYKANDVGHPTNRVSNCIHAISSLREGHRLYIAISSWGETASYFILEELTPWLIGPCQEHAWISSALGLDNYPLIHRRFGEHPHSGLVQGPFHRLYGGEKGLTASYGPPR